MGNIFFTSTTGRTEPDDFVERLRNVTRDLVYISETDAPLKPFRIVGAVGSDIAQEVNSFADIPAGTHSECASFEDLFARLTRKYDGADDETNRRADRFRGLYELLRAELSDLTVLRFGRIRIRIFVAGRTREGAIAGFETESVET